MDARRHKEKALQFFQRGKFAKAAEAWAQVCKADPKDNGSRLRLGDALSKAGQADAAFDAYKEAMDGFARQGFLPQAIAAAKLALVLRPNDFELEQTMLGFHAERLGRPPGASQGSLPSLDGPAAGFQSSPSSLLQGGPARGRPSVVLPGPPAMVPGPPPGVVPGPPPGLAPGPAPAVSSPSGASRSRPGALPLALPVDAPAAPEPALPALAAPEAGPSDLTPAPDLPPPAVTPVAPDLGVEDSLTDATIPGLGPRSPRVLPGVRRPDPPSRAELEATLIPGRQASPGAPMVDLHLSSTGADSTVFAINPFVRSSGSGTRVEPALQRPGPPAELADDELGRFPHIPLFDDLPAEAFLALVEESELQTLPAGQVILAQDAEGDSFYVICSGRVRVYREEPAGRRELAILEPGAFFGEMAVLTGARRSAWVVAEVDDTRLLRISGPLLNRVARQHPSVAEGLLTFARRRILSNVMSSEPLFAAFKRNERQDWADRFVPRELDLGELLMQPGGPPPGLAVVVSGHLQVSGGGRSASTLGPGALLGDVEQLSGVVETRVQALARSSVLLLAPRDAEALLGHPSNSGRRPALLEAGRRRSAQVSGPGLARPLA